MKFLVVAFATLALAVASPTQRALVQPAPGGPAPIIDLDNFEPIAIGPAIIDNFEPIAIGPAIVKPPTPSSSSPLVQIILNINPNVAGSPVVIEGAPLPTPVQVVEEAEAPEGVIVGEPVIVSPGTAPETINVASPVIVVDQPEAPETINVASPIFVPPVVSLPDTLN
ncbi:hypothetical protein RR46_06414 [Papilio xuthus]|uniref:Cuticular protein n=1 Tax=Papilio xuthus TaxID=66420 RepID=A0A194QCJ0_PAPXU|nr:hypothetical protein RR46_06414 [Papilio xuthus]